MPWLTLCSSAMGEAELRNCGSCVAYRRAPLAAFSCTKGTLPPLSSSSTRFFATAAPPLLEPSSVAFLNGSTSPARLLPDERSSTVAPPHMPPRAASHKLPSQFLNVPVAASPLHGWRRPPLATLRRSNPQHPRARRSSRMAVSG
jgi:hypothetical protein